MAFVASIWSSTAKARIWPCWRPTCPPLLLRPLPCQGRLDPFDRPRVGFVLSGFQTGKRLLANARQFGQLDLTVRASAGSGGQSAFTFSEKRNLSGVAPESWKGREGSQNNTRIKSCVAGIPRKISIRTTRRFST